MSPTLEKMGRTYLPFVAGDWTVVKLLVSTGVL